MTKLNVSHMLLMTPYEMDFLEEERMVVVLHGNSLVVAQEDMELHTVGDNQGVVQVFLPYSEEDNSVH
jgi:hypothetical protein